MESMKDLRFNKVIFAADTSDIVKAISKPWEWLALATQVDRIASELVNHTEWSVSYESLLASKSAFAIAQSVRRDGRF